MVGRTFSVDTPHRRLAGGGCESATRDQISLVEFAADAVVRPGSLRRALLHGIVTSEFRNNVGAQSLRCPLSIVNYPLLPVPELNPYEPPQCELSSSKRAERHANKKPRLYPGIVTYAYFAQLASGLARLILGVVYF